MCTNYISPMYNNIYQSLPIHVLWTQNTSKFKAFLFLIFFHWLVHCTFVIKAPNFLSHQNCINPIFIQFFFWQVNNFSAMINFCKQVFILFFIPEELFVYCFKSNQYLLHMNNSWFMVFWSSKSMNVSNEIIGLIKYL